MISTSILPLVALVPATILGSVPVGRAPMPQPPRQLVAEAQIWGAHGQNEGVAFLPASIEGHRVTIIIDPNAGDLALSQAGLSRAGISWSDTTTRLSAMTIGEDVLRNLPIQLINDPIWRPRRPERVAEVVGVVGTHVLSTWYDLVYDFPHQRVRLYAFSAKSEHGQASLPPEVHPSDCGKLIPLSPNAPAFAAMPVLLDGYPVTGVIEWQPYIDSLNGGHDEKMNADAFTALRVPAHSPRIQPLPEPHVVWDGVPVADKVADVRVMMGKSTVWTGPVKIFSTFEVNAFLPPRTPVMLLNLTTIAHSVLYYSTHSGTVCLNTPKP